jgi:tetratricopeptide (TPR) repeat protein
MNLKCQEKTLERSKKNQNSSAPSTPLTDFSPRFMIDFLYARFMFRGSPGMRSTAEKRKSRLRLAVTATLAALLIGIVAWTWKPSDRAKIAVLATEKIAPDEKLPAPTQVAEPRTTRELLDEVNYLEHALPLLKSKFGPDGPMLLASMTRLANNYAALGRHDDALKLFEQTLAWQKAKLGPDHANVFTVMNNLGNCYIAVGRYAEALTIYQQALPLQRAKFGPDHADTLRTMSNLANAFAALGENAEAIKLREETLARRQATLGFDHLETIASMNNLANSYAAMGRFADALKLHQETLGLQKTKLGADHANALLSMRSIAICLFELGRGAEAVPVIDECVAKAAGKSVHPRLMMDVVDTRLRHFQKLMDPAGCRATAEMWEKLKRADASSLYQAACFRAVTAAVMRAGDKSTETERQAAVEVERAMQWLLQAVAAGYKDVALMRTDRDLDSLRDRADFEETLAKLEAEQ